MREIRGKRALVTGAASGIGRAIALAAGARRARSVSRRHRRAGTGERCRRSAATPASKCRPAVRRGRAARSFGGRGRDPRRWGGVDILVNNAGITYYGRTDRMSAEHWDRLMRVNLLSHIQFTRELLPSLLARREAHVLNVCSMFGLVGMPKVTAYCTTKFAMVGFSESLRNEFGRQGLGVTRSARVS